MKTKNQQQKQQRNHQLAKQNRKTIPKHRTKSLHERYTRTCDVLKVNNK